MDIHHMKTVLTIAGSDSSAGAGIQADLKTITALGAYGATVITAVTAQNTLGVRAVHPVPADIVAEQMACVMEDLRPDAIKIGMLPNAEVVRAVADGLRQCQPPCTVVLDPVMVSTSGHRLMSEEAIALAYNELFPLCTLITPNLGEAGLLLALGTVSTPAQMEQAALTLSRRLGTSVLVKGGHLAGDTLCDILCHGGQLTRYPAPRIATSNLHGTGCTLSSAIATHLALGLDLPSAVAGAITYLRLAISAGRELHIGHGNGPLQHFFSSAHHS